MSDQLAGGPNGKGHSAISVVVHGVDEVPQLIQLGPTDTGQVLINSLRERGYTIDADSVTLGVRDADEDLDPDIALSAAVNDGSHLFVNRHQCQRINIDVRFGGVSKTHEFRASDTVARVLGWAEAAFEIVPNQRGQYRLKLPTSAEYLDNDLLLGELITDAPCVLRVDLVRAEQNAGACGEVARLLSDLQQVPFRRGLANGSWSIACIHDTVVTIQLAAGSARPRLIGLRLDITGYPEVPPQGTFWDLYNDHRLSSERWPILPDGNQAFRPDWAGGMGLYIACDRSALVPGQGHPEWATTLLYTNWRPDMGIARYLSVVSSLLRTASFRIAA